MKKTFILVAILCSQSLFAQIRGSQFETRHQDLILDAVQKKCFLRGNSTLISTTEQNINIDNGIVDVQYTTELNVEDTVDQNMTIQFKVTVQSLKSDMYDHVSKNWGAYSVLSVHCEQKN